MRTVRCDLIAATLQEIAKGFVREIGILCCLTARSPFTDSLIALLTSVEGGPVTSDTVLTAYIYIPSIYTPHPKTNT